MVGADLLDNSFELRPVLTATATAERTARQRHTVPGGSEVLAWISFSMRLVEGQRTVATERHSETPWEHSIGRFFQDNSLLPCSSNRGGCAERIRRVHEAAVCLFPEAFIIQNGEEMWSTTVELILMCRECIPVAQHIKYMWEVQEHWRNASFRRANVPCTGAKSECTSTPLLGERSPIEMQVIIQRSRRIVDRGPHKRHNDNSRDSAGCEGSSVACAAEDEDAVEAQGASAVLAPWGRRACPPKSPRHPTEEIPKGPNPQEAK